MQKVEELHDKQFVMFEQVTHVFDGLKKYLKSHCWHVLESLHIKHPLLTLQHVLQMLGFAAVSK